MGNPQIVEEGPDGIVPGTHVWVVPAPIAPPATATAEPYDRSVGHPAEGTLPVLADQRWGRYALRSRDGRFPMCRRNGM